MVETRHFFGYKQSSKAFQKYFRLFAIAVLIIIVSRLSSSSNYFFPRLVSCAMGRTRSTDRGDNLGQLEIVSTLSKSQVANLAIEYDIRRRFVCLTPLPEERVSSPPSSSTLAFYEDQLRAGLCFSLHRVFCDILRIFRIILSRLSPNSVQLVMAFIVLCHGHGIMPRASLFTNFFVLKKDFHGN